MLITDHLLAQLDREANRSREVLLAVPEGKYEWQPHERSMKFGYLAELVAIMPSWIAMQVDKDDLDIRPLDGSSMKGEPLRTSDQLVEKFDETVKAARSALEGTSVEHLDTKWQLKAGGKVVQEAARCEMIQDTFNHWAHHRGQMTVYLRLVGAKVPATYGPSADENAFR
jgi:uncharacterized damage-inducible protein DinB